VTVLHERAARSLHGKAFAIYGSSTRLATALGFSLGGALGSLNVSAVYVTSGVLAIVAGVGGALFARSQSSDESERPIAGEA
jgi:hypothetical protein